MTLLQALVLGIVQGASEFLPISSSGHLVLVPWLLGWDLDPQAAFIFDVLVQWGTTLAVVIYFWKDLWRLLRAAWRGLRTRAPLREPESRTAWWVVLASLPAAALGLGLKSLVQAAFGSPQAVSLFLLLTAALLLVGERIGRKTKDLPALSALDALLIGFAQALALFPGVSRSGATIAGGLMRDVEREPAARFSFLMSVPVMLGAGAVALRDLAQMSDPFAHAGTLLVGFLSAAVVGFAAIHWLLRYLSRHPLTLFAAYCAFIGFGGLLLYAARL